MKPFKITLYLLSVLCLFSCERKSATEYFDEAIVLEKQKKYAEAILLLDKAIEKYPKYLDAYINRGAYKWHLDRYSEAMEDYKQALRIDGNNILAIFNIGNLYLQLDSFSTSAKYFTRAIKLKNAEGSLILDLVPNDYTNTGNYDVPAKEIFYNRGFAFKGLQYYNSAILDFQKCIGLEYNQRKCKELINECMIARKNKNATDSLSLLDVYHKHQLDVPTAR